MYDSDSSKNVTDSSTIYKANTVAIFPLSEKVAYNIEQPEEMGHTSTDGMQHQFPPYEEVDAAVVVTAQEEGKGRYEKEEMEIMGGKGLEQAGLGNYFSERSPENTWLVNLKTVRRVEHFKRFENQF